MTRGPEDLAFSATAACVMVATGVALMLIIYALLTFIALLSPASAQQFLGMTS